MIIKIGNGARLVRTQLINSLLDLNIPVEVVDETGTSPLMGRGLHSSEVSDIIDTREHSNGKASIPRYLTRKVAKGELTIEEAIEIHQNPLQV
jgi:hypothetical protein